MGRQAENRVPSGNRCGHDPHVLRPLNIVASEMFPHLLRQSQKRLHEWYRFPHKYLPSLNALYSDHRQRSESRECVTIILQLLLNQVDLANLMVGYPMQGKNAYAHWNWADLIVKSGLGERRFYRGLEDLVKAKLITVIRRHTRTQEALAPFKGLVAIKKMNAKIFKELGFSDIEVENARKLAQKRADKNLLAYRKAANEITEVIVSRQKRKGPFTTMTMIMEQLPSKERTLTTTSPDVVPPQHKAPEMVTVPPIIKSSLGTSSILKNVVSRHDRLSDHDRCQIMAELIRMRQHEDNKDLSVNDFYSKYPHLDLRRL